MTSSKALFCFCIAFVLGITFYHFIKISPLFLWGFLFLVFLTVLVLFIVHPIYFNNRENLFIIGFCVLFFSLGILRLQIEEFNAQNDILNKLNDTDENIVLTGFIVREPDVRESSQMLKIKPIKFNMEEESLSDEFSLDKNRGGFILVTTDRYPEYKYLDEVKVKGKLKTPSDFEGFNYRNFLMKDRVYSVISFPEIELVPSQIKHSPFVLLYGKILSFKREIRQSIHRNFYPPQGAILEGMILGNSRALGQDLSSKLSETGVRHLTAISGLHIVILSSILMSSLLLMGLWRSQAFYFAVVLIWLYIAMVGFPPSGMRAGVMGSLFLLAGKLGKQNTSGRTITIAATIMLLHNPMLLAYDIGFQLSFLASMGIIYLKPLIEGYFNYLFVQIMKLKITFFQERFKNLSDIFFVTISAQIFTLPIIIYNFGTFPLISPVTNVLILPIIPILMFFGFLAAVTGIFSNILALAFVLPASALISYLLKIVDVFHQSWTSKTIENISWFWIVLFYAVAIALIFYLKRFKKDIFLSY